MGCSRLTAIQLVNKPCMFGIDSLFFLCSLSSAQFMEGSSRHTLLGLALKFASRLWCILCPLDHGTHSPHRWAHVCL